MLKIKPTKRGKVVSLTVLIAALCLSGVFHYQQSQKLAGANKEISSLLTELIHSNNSRNTKAREVIELLTRVNDLKSTEWYANSH